MAVELTVAVIAASAALMVFLLGVRQAALERKRKAYAEALADALSWLELPYLVRRRFSDDTSVLAEMSARFHHLQERILFHENWLRVELPALQASYKELVTAVKAAAQPHIQGAWTTAPIASAHEMNVGNLGLAPVDREVAAIAKLMRRRLTWWRVWEW